MILFFVIFFLLFLEVTIKSQLKWQIFETSLYVEKIIRYFAEFLFFKHSTSLYF